MVYPEKIAKRLASVESRTDGIDRNAVGTEANFTCGCVVCFSLSIDFESSLITRASFSSNGCGFMVAAADILAEKVKHRRLLELHGLDPSELTALIITELSEIKRERRECVNACVQRSQSGVRRFSLEADRGVSRRKSAYLYLLRSN